MIYKAKDPVYFCGDIHGNFHWLKNNFSGQDFHDCTIIFCGDQAMGFSSIKKFKEEISKLKLGSYLKKKKVMCYFIRGNHDNPRWFDGKEFNLPNLKAIPDYSVISTPKHNILCVGGGVSVDRLMRIVQMRYEYAMFLSINNRPPTEDECMTMYWGDEKPVYDEESIDNLSVKIDTVCSHAAPSVFPPESGPPKSWLDRDSNLEEDCRTERQTLDKVLNKLLQNNHPISQWYYGHYHRYEDSVYNGISCHMLDMARKGGFYIKKLEEPCQKE